MLDIIGSNYLFMVLGAMALFMAALGYVSLTDRDRPGSDRDKA